MPGGEPVVCVCVPSVSVGNRCRLSGELRGPPPGPGGGCVLRVFLGLERMSEAQAPATARRKDEQGRLYARAVPAGVLR